MSGVSRNVDLFPTIAVFLTRCRRLVSAPYGLDNEKNLILYRVQFWVQNLMTVGVTGLTLIGGTSQILNKVVYTNNSANNPYSIMSGLHYVWRNCYMVYVLSQWRMQRDGVRKIFEKMKAIDGEVRLDRKQEKKFLSNYSKWMLMLAFPPVLFIVKHFMINGISGKTVLNAAIVCWALLQPLISFIFMWIFLTVSTFYVECVNREIKSALQQPLLAHGAIYVVDRCRKLNQVEKLRNLRKLLMKIDELVEDVKEVFGNRIWIEIVHVFAEITFFIFFNITITKYFWSFASRSAALEIIMVNIWLALNAYKFMEIVKICSSLGEEGQNISEVVHEMLRESVDDPVRNELAIFSLRLLHRQNGLKVKGYLAVDRSLFSTLAWSCAVHTVALLQLDFPGYGNGICPFEDLLSLT